MKFKLSLFVLFASQAFASPNFLTYQGRIVKADGNPLEFSNVQFEFSIVVNNGSCVVYREIKTGINMVNSGGLFDVPIGDGTKLFPSASTFKLLDSFKSGIALSCEGGGSFTPPLGAERRLRVQFHDGIGWQLLGTDAAIRSVPFSGESLNALKFSDKSLSEFVLKSDLLTCNTGEFSKWNGTQLVCETAPTGGGGGGGGGVSSVSGVGVVSVANGTTTPTVKIQDGTASGQTLKWDGSAWSVAALATADITGLSTTLSGLSSDNSTQNTAISNLTTLVGQKIDMTKMPASCAVNTTLKYTSVSDTWTCDPIALSWSQITAGKPTTLSGFGITDKVVLNAGVDAATNVISFQSGNFASMPAASTAGRIYFATDTQATYRDSGSAWVKISGASVEYATTNTAGKAVEANDPRLPQASCASGNKMRWSGSAWLCETDAVSGGGGGVSSVSGVGVVSVANGTTTPTVKIQDGTASGQTLKWDGSAWSVAALATADITGLSTTLSGLSTDNSTQNTAISNLTTLVGQKIDMTKMPASCAVNTTLKYTSVSDTWTCDPIALSWSQITAGKPTTLAGYGVTDKVVLNAGVDAATNVISFQSGNFASMPAASTAGRIYFATDTQATYRDSGSAWVKISGASVEYATTNTAGKAVEANDPRLPQASCASGNKMRWSGSAWLCETDSVGTNYSAGTGLNLSGGTFSVSTVPVANGGTGVTSLTPNRMIASNVGGAITFFSCSAGQMLGFDAMGVYGCYNPDDYGVFKVGGNTATADLNIGNKSNFGLNLLTNNQNRLSILNDGKVGIGKASPSFTLDVNGVAQFLGIKIDGRDIGNGLQESIGVVAVIGNSCSTVGALAKDASGNLLVCDESTSALTSTDCSSVGVGAVTFSANGDMYVCAN